MISPCCYIIMLRSHFSLFLGSHISVATLFYNRTLLVQCRTALRHGSKHNLLTLSSVLLHWFYQHYRYTMSMFVKRPCIISHSSNIWVCSQLPGIKRQVFCGPSYVLLLSASWWSNPLYIRCVPPFASQWTSTKLSSL